MRGIRGRRTARQAHACRPPCVCCRAHGGRAHGTGWAAVDAARVGGRDHGPGARRRRGRCGDGDQAHAQKGYPNQAPPSPNGDLSRAGTSRVRYLTPILLPYELRCYWWETFECLRKLSLVGLPVFFEPGSSEQLMFVRRPQIEHVTSSELHSQAPEMNRSVLPTGLTRVLLHGDILRLPSTDARPLGRLAAAHLSGVLTLALHP